MQLPRRLEERAALRDLDALYRKADELLGRFRCADSAECCQLSTTGREPYLWPVEWLRVKKAIGARGGKVAARADGGCPLLSPDGRRCTIYADRPFGCRTFFCERVTPHKTPRDELVHLSRRLVDVAERLDPESDGPRRLTSLLGCSR